MSLENALELRPVASLLENDDGSPMRYRIPDYQRGYRWKQRQVKQLLDDIWDFIQASNEKPRSAFYCLQPLVVRKLNDGSYEVVDGQQRLTTIFILLDHCKKIIEKLGKKSFVIGYETKERGSTFLSKIDLNRKNENIDFHHICEAWTAIREWLQQHDSSHTRKLLQHLLNDNKAGHNVKFIWYELAPEDEPVEAFTRLNAGKIPLTETELVRAVFLRRAAQDDPIKNLSLRIAYEWDQIEKRLQNDAVWYFLQNEDNENSNRISLIFRLGAQMAGQIINGEDYVVFSHFSESLKLEQSAEDEWREAKKVFMELEEWYEDRNLFHIIGFVLHQAGDSLATITELLEKSQSSGKQEFAKSLRSRVYKVLDNDNELSSMSSEKLEEEITDLCTTVGYYSDREKVKVRSLLLLFNLSTLLQNSNSNIRFQFDSFKREKWDIEHIRSVSDSRPSSPVAQKEWLRHCQKFLRTVRNDDTAQKLASQIETFLDPDTEPENRVAFEKIDSEILTFFDESTDDLENGLGNLTLLDRRTNRGYRNAVFAVKRDILLDLDRSGIFVPLCTRNVFLKCYSHAVGSVIFWEQEDARGYLETISKTLIQFFQERGETGQ